jgi:hypothetical protein
MSVERLVVNASPLVCLFKCGLHDLLPSLRDAFAMLSGSGLWLYREFVEDLCHMEGE